MIRRTQQELRDWEEFNHLGRDFIRAKVPRGENQGHQYSIAKRLAERYEVKAFFASGGCGLLLSGRDLNTETDVLIKTTLRYDVVHHAQGRDKEGFSKQLQRPRSQLQTERRIMALLKNRGCNGVPNPNDFVFDSNPSLAGPYAVDGGGTWQFDDDALVASEPYLIMERIDGAPFDKLISANLTQNRVLRIMLQVANVLRNLHQPFVVAKSKWQLIYQDLKPGNIIVGACDYASLIDLGGCWLAVNGEVKLSGAFTAGYCPRECGGAEPLSPATDSYCVGSTMYHALTGIAPVDLLGSAASLNGPKAIAHDRWDWQRLRGRTTDLVFQFVKCCLAERPADRPRDGAVLFDEIRRLLRQS